MKDCLTYLSPAKLNLGLKIVGKRDDGYHLLKTVFCLIDLFDEIQIQILPHDKISLIQHEQAWPYTKDLAYIAAKLLKETTGCKLGANLQVKKTIPAGGGLGGGSSNAATILVALNYLWQTNLEQQQLIELGRKIGADVPFFIYGKNALAEGTGDHFSGLEVPLLYHVLIRPNFHIPTKKIFTNLVMDFSSINISAITPEYLIKTHDNDLQHVAVKLYPELQNILNDLTKYGNPAMTGSGSVIYLSYSEQLKAKKVATELGKSYNTYLVKSLRFSPIFNTSL